MELTDMREKEWIVPSPPVRVHTACMMTDRTSTSEMAWDTDGFRH